MSFLDSLAGLVGIHLGNNNPQPAPKPAPIPPAFNQHPVSPFQTKAPAPVKVVPQAPIQQQPVKVGIPAAPPKPAVPSPSKPSSFDLNNLVDGSYAKQEKLIQQDQNNRPQTGLSSKVSNIGQSLEQGAVNQVKTLPNAIAANVAAHTNNPIAEQHAEAALKGDVAPGKALLNYQQTEHPTAKNIARGVAEGTGDVLPYVLGSATGEIADKGLEEAGANPITRQLIRRGTSALTNELTGIGNTFAQQTASGQKINLKSAAKSSIPQAIIGAALPGAKATPTGSAGKTQKADVSSFLKGEHDNGVKVVKPTTTPPVPSKVPAALGVPAKSNFLSDTEQNLRTLQGNKTSNDVRLLQLSKQASKDTSNSENVYHALEDPTKIGSLSKDEQATLGQVKQLQKATGQVKADTAGKEYAPTGDNYVHRVVLGKNSNPEKYLNDERLEPTESGMRTTVDSNKKLTNQVIVDQKTGARQVVTIKDGRVTAWDKGESTDLGPLKKNLPDQVKEAFDPAQRDALQKTANNLGVKSNRVVKIRGNAAGRYNPGTNTIETHVGTPDDTLLHELGHKADEKFGLQGKFVKDPELKQEMRDLTDLRGAANPSQAKYLRTGDEKVATMFQAYLHAPDLFKETAPKTFDKFSDFLDKTPEMAPVRDMKPSLELRSSIVGDKQAPKEFIDKAGNHYNIERGTSKEIEANTSTKYHKDALFNSAVDHTNAVNAANAKGFRDWFTNHPEFKDHAVENTEKLPAGYTPDTTRYFPGYSFDKPTTKLLNTYLGKADNNTSALGRLYQTGNRAATQFITLNPLVHTQNLVAQAFSATGNAPLARSGILSHIPSGPESVIKAGRTLASLADPGARMASLHDYLQAGGHLESYGKNQASAISDAFDKLNLPDLNKSNAKVMSNIDTNIRVTAYKTLTNSGMSPAEAVSNIDNRLGKPDSSGKVAQNVGMFFHFFKSMAQSVGNQAAHPIKNLGSIANTAAVLGGVLAIDKGVRAATGNPNAHVKLPGELGLSNDVAKVGMDAVRRNTDQAVSDTSNLVTSHVAPLINAAANQAYGKDLFTGQALNNTTDRTNELVKNLVAPAQNVTKVQGGKMSLPEALTTELGGITTPHAAGNPAAPNFAGKGVLSDFNAKNTVPAQGSDKTGYSQEQQYYTAYDNATKGLTSNPKALAAFNLNYGPTKNPTTGKYASAPNVEMTVANSAALNAYPQALNAATQLNKTLQSQGQKIDPFFNLTPAQQKAYNSYETMAPLSADRTDWLNKNPWYNQFSQQQSDYFNGLPAGATGKPQNPIKYPTPNANVQQQMNQYSSITNSAFKTQFLASHPDVVNQLADQTAYDNQVRVARGYAAVKGYPSATPQLESFINSYNNASKAQRTDIRNSNPSEYQNMIAYYDSGDLSTIATQASLSNLVGEPDTSQKELKDISSIAQDIYQNPSGGYSVVPAGWMNGLTNSSSSGYGSFGGSSSSSASKVFKAKPLSISGNTTDNSIVKASAKGFKVPSTSSKTSKNFHVGKLTAPKLPKGSKKQTASISSDGLVKLGI